MERECVREKEGEREEKKYGFTYHSADRIILTQQKLRI
jgi:hypothetical protein